MVHRDYLEVEPGPRRYRLGLRLWQVAQAYLGNADLVTTARPIMDTLVAETGETVQLARLDGVENVYLAIAESPHPMKLVSEVGTRLFAHATGLGKVLLAALPAEESEARLRAVELPRFTRHTVVDVDRLIEMLAVIRSGDTRVMTRKYVIGCRCIAIPIRDASGRVVAAMSVSVPTPRYDDESQPTSPRR
ncbi:MAG: IclR family transcriptional regulator [Chloroflexota bacterium]